MFNPINEPFQMINKTKIYMSRRQSHTQPYRRQRRKQDNSSQHQKENTGRTKNKQNNTTLSVQTVRWRRIGNTGFDFECSGCFLSRCYYHKTRFTTQVGRQQQQLLRCLFMFILALVRLSSHKQFSSQFCFAFGSNRNAFKPNSRAL